MDQYNIHCIITCNFGEPAHVELSSQSVEDAIRELVTATTTPLIGFGLTREWLDEYGLEPLEEDPCFQNETRVVRWHAVYGDSESDDVIVDVYFVDFSVIDEEWCCVFLNSDSEAWIDYVDAAHEVGVFRKLQQGELGEFGFECESDDCNEAFPLEWVRQSLPNFSRRVELAGGVVEYLWDRRDEFDEWGELRCFVFRRQVLD